MARRFAFFKLTHKENIYPRVGLCEKSQIKTFMIH